MVVLGRCLDVFESVRRRSAWRSVDDGVGGMVVVVLKPVRRTCWALQSRMRDAE